MFSLEEDTFIYGRFQFSLHFFRRRREHDRRRNAVTRRVGAGIRIVMIGDVQRSFFLVGTLPDQGFHVALEEHFLQQKSFRQHHHFLALGGQQFLGRIIGFIDQLPYFFVDDLGSLFRIGLRKGILCLRIV